MRRCLWAWLCGAFVWGFWPALTDAAKASKEPWFVVGKAATQQREKATTGGLLLELLWLPKVNFLTSSVQPFVSLELTGQRLSLLGHADLHWSQVWSPPVVSSPLIVLEDGGSLVQLTYRWPVADRYRGRKREVRLLWFPDRARWLLMGESLETLWTVFPATLRGNLDALARFGAAFSWDFFDALLLIKVNRSRYVIEKRQEYLPTVGFVARIRHRPLRWLRWGIFAGAFQGGTLSRFVGATGGEYRGFGTHPFVALHWGVEPSAILILRRRSRDPRRQVRTLPKRRQGHGLALMAEFGLRGHWPQNFAFPDRLSLELAYATTVRLRGQWGVFQGELQFHWHNLEWLFFDLAGMVQSLALTPRMRTDGLIRVAGTGAFLLRPHLVLAFRVELIRLAVFDNRAPGSDRHDLFRTPKDYVDVPRSMGVPLEVESVINLRWEPWPSVSLALEGWLLVETAQVFSERGSDGRLQYRHTSKYTFGTELLAQVRFR